MRKALTFFVFSFFILAPKGFAQSDLLKVHFIDVGYGDAILIEIPGSRNLLIDAGGRDYEELFLGFLKSRAIKKLDTVILTHPHKNHFGNLPVLIQSLSVGEVLINGDQNAEEGYAELLSQLKSKNIPVKKINAGTKKSFGDFKIKVLHPQKMTAAANDNAVVTWLAYKDTFFLFTADIGPEIQNKLLKKYKKICNADVVQIPHHGGPVSDEFTSAFKESAFFAVSTGPNQWNLPDPGELRRIEDTLLRTDQNGTVSFQSDGQTVKILATR